MTDLFRDRWTLVTGASSGLGEQFARQLAARGSHLVLTARSRDSLVALAAQLGASQGVQTRVVVADLASPEGITALTEGVDALGLEIDHLVANAGFGTWGPFLDESAESQTQMVRLNVEALVALSHHFARGMAARGRGGLLLVASTASFQPTPMFAVYGATKAFVRSFGEATAEELAGTGVRVSVLCPGPVETGFQARAKIEIAPAQRGLVMEAAEVVRRGLDGYAAGQILVVPGVVNRLGATLASVAPSRLVVPLVRRINQTRRTS